MGPSAGNSPLYSFPPPRPPDPDDFRRMMQIASDETASRCREIKETLASLRSEFRQLMLEFIASPSSLLEGASPPIYRPGTQSLFVTPPPTQSPKTQSSRLQFRPPPLTQPTAESSPRLGDAQSLLVSMSRIKQASGETILATGGVKKRKYLKRNKPFMRKVSFKTDVRLQSSVVPPLRLDDVVLALSNNNLASFCAVSVRTNVSNQCKFLNDDCGAVSYEYVAKFGGIEKNLDNGKGESCGEKIGINSVQRREFEEPANINVTENDKGPSFCWKRKEHISSSSSVESNDKVEEAREIGREYCSPQFVINSEERIAEFENARILISHQNITSSKDSPTVPVYGVLVCGSEGNALFSTVTVKQVEQGLNLCGKSAIHLFDKMSLSDGLCDAKKRTVTYMGIQDKGGGLATHRKITNATRVSKEALLHFPDKKIVIEKLDCKSTLISADLNSEKAANPFSEYNEILIMSCTRPPEDMVEQMNGDAINSVDKKVFSMPYCLYTISSDIIFRGLLLELLEDDYGVAVLEGLKYKSIAGDHEKALKYASSVLFHQDVGASQLLLAAYESLNEVVKCCTNENYPMVVHLVLIIMNEHHLTLEGKKLSSNGRDEQYVLCACSQVQERWITQMVQIDIAAYIGLKLCTGLRVINFYIIMIYSKVLIMPLVVILAIISIFEDQYCWKDYSSTAKHEQVSVEKCVEDMHNWGWYILQNVQTHSRLPKELACISIHESRFEKVVISSYVPFVNVDNLTIQLIKVLEFFGWKEVLSLGTLLGDRKRIFCFVYEETDNSMQRMEWVFEEKKGYMDIGYEFTDVIANVSVDKVHGKRHISKREGKMYIKTFQHLTQDSELSTSSILVITGVNGKTVHNNVSEAIGYVDDKIYCFLVIMQLVRVLSTRHLMELKGIMCIMHKSVAGNSAGRSDQFKAFVLIITSVSKQACKLLCELHFYIEQCELLLRDVDVGSWYMGTHIDVTGQGSAKRLMKFLSLLLSCCCQLEDKFCKGGRIVRRLVITY